MSASVPGAVGPTVVVGSSQLITTLSALAYLRWRGIQASVLRIVSLKAGELIHASSAFEQELQCLATAEGHRSIVQSHGPTPLGFEPLHCDLLLLPRLDDQEGQTLLVACPCAEVVELGESIGVETRLYSFSARRTRARALQALRARHGPDGFSLAPLVPIHRDVELPRLRCLLEVCSAFRRQIEAAGRSPDAVPSDAVLVCLPYLKVRSWRWRFKLAGRQLGWRQPPQLLHLAYIRAALTPLLTRQGGQAVWIQAHPKNRRHRELIQVALQPMAGSAWLQLLDGEAPLEVLLTQQLMAGPAQGPVAGFGTNLLSAAVFLHPHADRVQLCAAPHGKGPMRWWWRTSTALFQRRELLRRRHVQTTLTNLRCALQQLNGQ